MKIVKHLSWSNYQCCSLIGRSGPKLWRQAVVSREGCRQAAAAPFRRGAAIQLLATCCERLGWTLTGLIILYGSSDGFCMLSLYSFTIPRTVDSSMAYSAPNLIRFIKIFDMRSAALFPTCFVASKACSGPSDHRARQPLPFLESRSFSESRPSRTVGRTSPPRCGTLQGWSRTGLAVPVSATGSVTGKGELHVDRFKERPQPNGPWRQVQDSQKNCGKLVPMPQICSSRLSKSQRGPSHPYGPRPNNRRHLSAVQEMFGRKSGHASALHQPPAEPYSKLEACFAVYPWLLAKIVTGTSSAFTAAFQVS